MTRIRHWFRRRRVLAVRLKMVAIAVKGLFAANHPLLVHLVATRRCNLTCGYCNEYDSVSPPVPLDEMLERVERLADLGSQMVSVTGGEPMLHPDLEAIIRRIRRRGMVAELLTNGYLLTEDRIKRLNDAGLQRMQISIDNVQPDEVSMKSLKTLDKKLELLARYGEFDLNINSVIGGGIKNPEDALVIAEAAKRNGFSNTLGVIHTDGGQLVPLGPKEREVHDLMTKRGRSSFSLLTKFKDTLAEGGALDFRCRAGARYLYVCEDGLVHYCSQQRGYPGIPLSRYTREDIRREFRTEKSCAPLCTVSCVRTISMLDEWRGAQRGKAFVAEEPGELIQIGDLRRARRSSGAA